ncbi:hypothetical protein Slin14017_G092790 [Septoria linicola]|nr:hypothetical protein Slin14017_G092790 [Septoria linicola]
MATPPHRIPSRQTKKLRTRARHRERATKWALQGRFAIDRPEDLPLDEDREGEVSAQSAIESAADQGRVGMFVESWTISWRMREGRPVGAQLMYLIIWI